MRKPISRLNVSPDFRGHAAKPVFIRTPRGDVTKLPVPWGLLATIGLFAMAGFAVVWATLSVLNSL